MQFTHLIEINDPLNPQLQPLTREQLWRGLVLRAEAPHLFMPHLDLCTILERSSQHLLRELHYGAIVIRDSVTLTPEHQVHYHVPAQPNLTASNLEMQIEEPEPGRLYVRFTYRDEDHPDEGGDGGDRGDSGDAASASAGAQKMYDELRRSVYEETDIDTIRLIRTMTL